MILGVPSIPSHSIILWISCLLKGVVDPKGPLWAVQVGCEWHNLQSWRPAGRASSTAESQLPMWPGHLLSCRHALQGQRVAFSQSVGIEKHQFAVGREPSRHVFCSEMSNRNVGANECTPLQTTQVALMASLLLADFLPKANSLVHAHVLFVGIKITCYIWNSLTYVGWWSSEKGWWLLSSFQLGKYQFMCNFSLYSF